jgi:hypothetical protein
VLKLTSDARQIGISSFFAKRIAMASCRAIVYNVRGREILFF